MIEELEKLMGWVGNGSNFSASGILEGWGTSSVGFKGAARLRALAASSGIFGVKSRGRWVYGWGEQT